MVFTHLAFLFFDGAGGVAAEPEVVATVLRGGTSKRDKRLKRKRPRYFWEEEPKQETSIQAPPEAVPTERPGPDYAAFDAVAASIEEQARAQLEHRRRRRKRMLAALLIALEDDE